MSLAQRLRLFQHVFGCSNDFTGDLLEERRAEGFDSASRANQAVGGLGAVAPRAQKIGSAAAEVMRGYAPYLDLQRLRKRIPIHTAIVRLRFSWVNKQTSSP